MEEVEPQNCQACGQECLAAEMALVKLGQMSFNLCSQCRDFHSAEDSFKEATNLIISVFESE